MDCPPSHPQSVKRLSGKHTQLFLLTGTLWCEIKCGRPGGWPEESTSVRDTPKRRGHPCCPFLILGHVEECLQLSGSLGKKGTSLSSWPQFQRSPVPGDRTTGRAWTKPAAAGVCGPWRAHMHVRLTISLHARRSAPACFRSNNTVQQIQ